MSDKEGTEETHSLQDESDEDLAQEIGLNAYEYLEECFYNEVSVLDRDKFNAIPEIVKSDLTILRHLGKGSFSDVFEVVVCDGPHSAETSDDFPGGQQGGQSRSDNLPGGASHADDRTGNPLGGEPTVQVSQEPPGDLSRRRSSRRGNPHSSSLSSRTLVKPSQLREPQRILAMKCLRPSIRSDADQFAIGSEDLVHETAILANLSHRHVIQLYGRAYGQLTEAFVLNDGYFILLERLKETLPDRLNKWRDADGVKKGPMEEQLQVAYDVADAMVYLHSKKIIFRDLKPDNVGFDGRGVLKLFDFGFAAGLPERGGDNPDGLLFDRCGTPRFMAPEVGLSQGYGLASDVYSFGILLWQICALAKPFAAIMSAEEFDRKVFQGQERPKVGGHWPRSTKTLMRRCWNTYPGSRPNILEVRSSLAHALESAGDGEKSATKTLRLSMTKSMTYTVRST